ncbi:hypothetical protein F5J12DRAFT_782890 [Pisolithus orientalis]|uniref:uncharacterized protein n=1 Tax=Pisolithus orientalis TaxID=936130 RepID=UPI00222491FF|nr:uncharacterized protein F5J12DRAFT_782890 [Pisolithus orientalis]KAI6006644.1 hypothetical protein F5J12DRAFT_782890 [Pisolithus orientalis]
MTSAPAFSTQCPAAMQLLLNPWLIPENISDLMGRNQESKKALVVLQSPQKKSSWKRQTPAVNTGTAAAMSLKDINQLKEQGKQMHLKAARMRTAYAAHVC